jgi:SAM-dependent methyltransferase
MSLPDYSDWLTPERLLAEEKLWGEDVASGKGNAYAAGRVQALCDEHGLKTVLELGCGTGWVPYCLQGLRYTGLDANPHCLDLARQKNPSQSFEGPVDFRTWAPKAFDLACSFSVLKHFRLDEWIDILAKLLVCGRYGLFSVTISPAAHDDGTEYTHTWVTWEHVHKACELSRHSIIAQNLIWTGDLGEDYYVTTRRS